jgi:hypothetical protein
MTRASLCLAFAFAGAIGIAQASTVLFVASRTGSKILTYDGPTGAAVNDPFVSNAPFREA